MVNLQKLPVIGCMVNGVNNYIADMEESAAQWQLELAQFTEAEKLLPPGNIDLDEYRRKSGGYKSAPPVTNIAAVILRRAVSGRTTVRLEAVNDHIAKDEAFVRDGKMCQVLNVYLNPDSKVPDLCLPDYCVKPLFFEFNRFCRVDENNPCGRIRIHQRNMSFYFDATLERYRGRDVGHCTRSMVLSFAGIRRDPDDLLLKQSEEYVPSGHFSLEDAENALENRKVVPPWTVIAVRILTQAMAAGSSCIRLRAKNTMEGGNHPQPTEELEILVDDKDMLPPMWTFPRYVMFALFDEFTRIAQVPEGKAEGNFTFDYVGETWKAHTTSVIYPKSLASREPGAVSRLFTIALEEVAPVLPDADTV